MFVIIFCVVLIANSVISRNVPNFEDLDEEDKILFRAAYDTPSDQEIPSYNAPSYNAPTYNHETPSYNAPSYNHETPSYNAPSYNHETPSYNAPPYNHETPSYKPPAYNHETPSYNAPSYNHETPSYNAPSYNHETSSYKPPAYNHNDYPINVIPVSKLDLLNDGMWALKAKMKELKAFNKALAANLLLTKVKVKELMANIKPLKIHQHVAVDEKPVYNYQPPPSPPQSYPQYEQPHPQYTAPAPSPQYTAQHYGTSQHEYDPYYGN